MRVLHIIQRDDPATGGAARVAVELVKRLPTFGVEAKCLFVYGPPGPFAEELPGQCAYLRLGSARDAVWRAGRLLGFLRRERPQIVHHHDGLIWTHALTRLTFGGARYGHAHLDPPSPGAPWRHHLAGWLHRSTYDRLVCISKSTSLAWAASGFPAERTIIIPNGVDTETFTAVSNFQRTAVREELGIPQDVLVVGYVGRLHNEMKGTDDFVRVLAALPLTTRGIMAGGGPDEANLRTLADKLGVSGRLLFTGVLSSPLPVYRAMDALIITSHYEPFGLVALEAAACGLPVIAFAARGGLMDLLTQIGALVVERRDLVVMAKAILEATHRDTDSAGRDRKRRRLTEKFSWITVARMLADDYKAHVNSGRLSRAGRSSRNEVPFGADVN